MVPLSMPRLLLRRWAGHSFLTGVTFLSIAVAIILMAAVPIYLKSLERLSLDLSIAKLARSSSNIHIHSRHIRLTESEINGTESLVSIAIDSHLHEIYDTHERYFIVDTYLAGYPRNPLPESAEATHLASRAYFRSYTNLLDHVNFVDGGPSQGYGLDDFDGRTRHDGPLGIIVDARGEWPIVDAIVSVTTARVFGIEVGDLVTVTQDMRASRRIYARVAGIFTASNPTEDYWQFHASTFIDPRLDGEESISEIATAYDTDEPPMPLFISKSSLVEGLARAFPGVMADSMWFISVDKEQLKGLEIFEVREKLSGFETDVLKSLPGSEVTTGITDTLNLFERSSFFSKVPLMLLLSTIVVTIVFYLSMMVSCLVQGRQGEGALLRSRGMGTIQLLRLNLIEGIGMVTGVMLLAPFVAMGVVALAGKLPHFRAMTNGAFLPVEFSGMSFVAAMGAGLLCLAILVIPDTFASRNESPSRKLQSARSPTMLMFHRHYFDVGILVLLGLVFWELHSRGYFISGGFSGRIEVNQLLLFGPALFMIVTALTFIRLLPSIARYVGGESLFIVHSLTAVSLLALGSGFVISKGWDGGSSGWIGGALMPLGFLTVYVCTARSMMWRFRLVGLVVQATLALGLMLLNRPDVGNVLFVSSGGLMVVVMAQALFMFFQAFHSFTPVWFLLGLRNMARNPLQYTWLIVLLVLTTGVGIAATTVGRTLERSKNEQVLYDVAADFRVTGVSAWMGGDLRTIKNRFAQIPGVTSVSPALRHTSAIGPTFVELLAVDSTEFPYISWYRDDFSDGPLGMVMGSLQASNALDRIALPEGSTSIGTWVKPFDEYPNMVMYVVLVDSLGNQGMLRLGMVGSTDWHLIRAPLPLSMSYPVYLSAVQILEPYFGEGQVHTSGAILVDDIHVTVGPANIKYTLEDFEGKMAWVPILTSALSSDEVFTTQRDWVSGSRSAVYVFRGESSRGIRGFYQSPTGGPVPVVASASLARTIDVGIGDTAVIEVEGMRIPVEFRDVVSNFPTMRAHEGRFILVDLQNLLDNINVLRPEGGITPNELFLKEASAAGQTVRDAVRSLVVNPDRQVYERSSRIEQFGQDPLATAGWTSMETLSLLIVIGAVAFGYFSYIWLFRDKYIGEVTILQSIGVSRRQLLGLLGFEHIVIAMSGLGLGTWTGFQMSRLIVEPLVVTDIGHPVLPPFILTTDWGLMAPAYVIIVLILLAPVLVLYRKVGRLDLSVYERGIGGRIRPD